MKNPLRKRLPRMLREELGKYLVVFLFLLASIGFVSGFLVADNSMIIAYNESFEKYNIEDGKFLVGDELTEKNRKKAESYGVKIYENFYVEEDAPNESTMRIFKWREDVNKVCLMEGEKPSDKNEIAIDRMYADNNEISVGDIIEIGGKECVVSGLVALSDYSCLFSDNNDSMFDASKFGVAVMTEEGWKTFPSGHVEYGYSWIYDTKPKDDEEEKDVSETLMKKLNNISPLEDFVPQYVNQAIQFTGEDMGGDRSMMITLLYVIIVIMAFVFGVTTSNTIVKESCVIGTLRASGYTKGELVRHYMAMPVLVTVVGAVFGNVLGYTIFKDISADLYYGSYSLPTYKTVWNAEAFILTTIVPLILMVVINLAILVHKLSLSPIKFIRRDLRKGRQRKGICLPGKMAFFSRFRIRIILQNLSNYAILFVGIIFANLLLMFGLLLPAVLSDFQDDIVSNMLCKYQYVLNVPEYDIGDGVLKDFLQESLRISLDTDNPDAEKCCFYSLNTLEGKYKSDKITVYGIEADSRYVPADIDESGVLVSKGYAEKFGVEPGDSITLKEPYEDKEYEFQVAGTYDYPGALSVFMTREMFNKEFDEDASYFNGYFSDSEITDMDEDYIASVIDEEDLTKLSRQLQISMGSMMTMIDVFAIIMFVILIYLLSKIIIEKNAQSISMVKILGYQTGEISRLYIMSTSIVVVICLLLSLPIEAFAMRWLYLNFMMTSISGWVTYVIDPIIYIKMIVLGIGAYAVVAILEYRKIGRVPLGEALKNVE